MALNIDYESCCSMPSSSVSAESLIDLLITEQILESDLPLEADTDLFSLGLDSVAMMTLILQIEDRFGIAVAPAEMKREAFATAGSLAQFLNAKLTA